MLQCPWGCVSLYAFYKQQGHSVPMLPGELPHSRQAKGQTAGASSNFSREFISSIVITPENSVPQSLSFCVFEATHKNTVVGVCVMWTPGCICNLVLTHLSAWATLGRSPVPGSVQQICLASGILALNTENMVVNRGKLPNNPNSFDFH